jgi:hypothetical protein
MNGKMWWKSVIRPVLVELSKAFLVGGAYALGKRLVDRTEACAAKDKPAPEAT